MCDVNTISWFGSFYIKASECTSVVALLMAKEMLFSSIVGVLDACGKCFREWVFGSIGFLVCSDGTFTSMHKAVTL